MWWIGTQGIVTVWVHDVARKIRLPGHSKRGRHRGFPTRPDGSHVGAAKGSLPGGKNSQEGTVEYYYGRDEALVDGTRVQESGRKYMQYEDGIGGNVGTGTQ